PATGEATLSNAGHPYPLLAVDGEVRELPLPSLPLGQGPPRTYQDLHLRLTPGAALVFCSDGLFEAQDGDGSFYGFERAQRLLAEWAVRDLGSERLFVTRYRELVARSGFRLTPGRPRVSLTADDATARDPRSGKGSPLSVEVHHTVQEPGAARDDTLEASFLI